MSTIETLRQVFRFATLTVRPITCEKGVEIFPREELLRETWEGYNMLRDKTQHFCDGHCSHGCQANTLRTKLEPVWEEHIR